MKINEKYLTLQKLQVSETGSYSIVLIVSSSTGEIIACAIVDDGRAEEVQQEMVRAFQGKLSGTGIAIPKCNSRQAEAVASVFNKKGKTPRFSDVMEILFDVGGSNIGRDNTSLN